MKKIVAILVLVLFVSLSSCTSDKDFEKGKMQLESMGYTEIENTGYSMFCCGEDDTFKTGFKARDKNGQIVNGCFCSGIFKGVTVRY